MKDFLCSIVIAFSFLTAIPLPMLEWTEKRIKYLPWLMPVVGLGIGFLGYGLFLLLSKLGLSAFSKAVVMVLFFMAITGGLHLDGLMDTADAYFSRRSIEQKLQIMKDSRVGAFAVMTLVSLLLIKTALFYELFSRNFRESILLLLIPFLARVFQAFVLCFFPYAKKDGLAVMFGQMKRKGLVSGLAVSLILAIMLINFLAGVKGLLIKELLLLLCLTLFTVFYYFSAKKNFGGITGDIVGAYVEMAEVLALGMLVIMIALD